MTFFILGIIMTIFSSIVLYFTITQEGVSFMGKVAIIVTLIAGITALTKGIIKIIQNLLTKHHGEECYGMIQRIYPTGTFVKGQPELQADILTYIVSESCTITTTEIIGFDSFKYPVNSYIKGKYYKGDINIEKIINNSRELPSDIAYYFKSLETSNKNN